MGGGSYSVDRATTRSNVRYKGKSSREVFTNKEIDNAMSPQGVKIRESRDSEEHPESLSIIIGLDVTGSMGYIPKHMITHGLTEIMGTIIQSGIKHPQVLFLAIGDHEVDRAPLQVAQFESSDELLSKWLEDVYLEGGGGGNAGESYPLAWYFGGNHTAIDCLEKRDKKGYLFTIGDEPPLMEYPKGAIEDIMGKTASVQQDSIHGGEFLKQAQQLYNVKHINLRETRSGGRPETFNSWKQILGQDAINVAEHEEVPNVIAKTIIRNEEGRDVKVSDDTTSESETKDDEVIL